MIEKVILKEVPERFLFAIEEKGRLWNISQISRRRGFAFPYGSKLIKIFLENGLITKEIVDGRSYHVLLTKKGREVYNKIKKINEILK